MSDGTKIEWTDATWNPITGCSVVSPGCTNCYAMRLAGTRMKHHPTRAGLTVDSKAGPVWNGEVRFNEAALLAPLQWARPRMIFVCAHGDLFAEQVPDDWIDKVFAVMALCPQHTFQVLTKRPARMREYLEPVDGNALAAALQQLGRDEPRIVRWPLPNVWLGTSVEDQRRADERIPELLATPAAVRFISAEPLLGPIDIASYLRHSGFPEHIDSHGIGHWDKGAVLDWVIVGGESGPGARPMHPDWARSLRDQCAAAGVAFFFKQIGEWGWPGDEAHHASFARAVRGEGPWPFDKLLDRDGGMLPGDAIAIAGREYIRRVGKKAAGRLLDGVEHNGMPEARR